MEGMVSRAWFAVALVSMAVGVGAAAQTESKSTADGVYKIGRAHV